MPIVYKQHLDSRDGTIYNCVLMPDGKWWSAVDLGFAGYGSGGYYIHEDAQSALPPGTHGPLQAEWLAMISASGGGLGLKTTTGWGGANGLDTYGFALAPTGYLNDGLINPERSCHIVFPHTPGAVRGVIDADPYSQSVGYGYSGADQAYSYKIRFIVDVFNEPIPPTKIHGTFSGSGVKVFAAMPSDTTFEVPLSAQSTTELTISKDFITTFGPFIGRVRILVVDGEYISEWKDWDFRI